MSMSSKSHVIQMIVMNKIYGVCNSTVVDFTTYVHLYIIFVCSPSSSNRATHSSVPLLYSTSVPLYHTSSSYFTSTRWPILDLDCLFPRLSVGPNCDSSLLKDRF